MQKYYYNTPFEYVQQFTERISSSLSLFQMSHDHHMIDSTGNASHGMHIAHVMDHGTMNHGNMDHGSMNHGGMDHGSMHQSVEGSTGNACSDMGMHGMLVRMI